MKRRRSHTDNLLLILFIALLLQVANLERGEVANDKGPLAAILVDAWKETLASAQGAWNDGMQDGEERPMEKTLVKARIEVSGPMPDAFAKEELKLEPLEQLELVEEVKGRLLTFETRKPFERY